MIPVNEAQQKLQDLIDSVTVSHEPIIIEGCDGNAVLLSEGDWKSVQETLYLLSIPGMRESIREGLATPVEECTREKLEFCKDLLRSELDSGGRR
ncbi:MAG: type II toxin-antitoxin system Phd/YefM family antitoxin [Microcystis sp. LE19-10.1B]|jgi:antitoxin YefM|uniref:type II toxin-antitoxin system Phd/YefM family antitoxin n=1 Tax=Microcystis sp. LE19-10.1B TaxID=3016428 RepID=UPI0022BD9590|nr:type II toxin-antitoxin system Phd/YefM family antitoxin [Microcystis sp. LE19-10.1B]MCZ8027576.1 type II toxin-antitoxin system Phd/YefM family antitoxin [Microcystis sp. LE19-10.1B]MCZ8361242.1 type II toxin-antitoxin system Phd/YefM family antitoxin [Microcystis sp. LE19-251.1A]